MPKNSSLGKALIRRQQKVVKSSSTLHTTDDLTNLKSVIDQNNLDEFMSMANLANKQFTAERSAKIVSESRIVGPTSKISTSDLRQYRPLQLPHRPKWESGTTPEQLQEMEKKSFLEWRKGLALTEESEIDSAVTPFEKNLEVWRQLWRVIERSHIVCQIVDARNPLFFRSPDLETYVRDLNKRFVLVLNKADLVQKEVREMWGNYLNTQNIEHYYFSASLEQEHIDKDTVKENECGPEYSQRNLGYIYSGTEFLRLFTHNEPIVIGCVGYPNVGKSSVINVLCKKKLVGVASQPGKTKHLQTLILTPDITLCDCPGLVFPSLLSSRAEMVTCGVLPIDQLKDVLTPVEIICVSVRSNVLEEKYGVALGGRVSAVVLLQKIAVHRGFFTGSGLPDEIKVGKMVLKDFVNGRLPFSHLPPGFEPELENEAEEVKIDIDQEFFQQKPQGKLRVEQTGTIIYEGEHKLSKQEKRELKFAARRGEDPNEKLKQILQSRTSGTIKNS